MLAWRAGADAELFTLEGARFVRRFALAGLRFPYSLAWVGEARVAVRWPATARGRRRSASSIDDLRLADPAPPDGRGVPPARRVARRILQRLGEVPNYPVAAPTPTTPGGTRALLALSRATYARRAA